MKHMIPTLLVAAFTIGILTPTAPVAAACSANGYHHSQGKCDTSFKHKNKQRYDNHRSKKDDDRDYSYQRPFLQFRNYYNNNLNNGLDNYIAYLLELIKQLEALRADGYYNRNDGGFDITTRTAVDVDETEATLRGRMDFGDEDELTVWFEYGSARTNLNQDSTKETYDDSDNENFEIDIADLDDNRRYYFRAVAEDEDGDKKYGMILSFSTDSDSSRADEPVAITRTAQDITDDSAELNGSVDMNDFSDGIVFFVYGEDDNQIDDVENDFDTYADIDEDGDDLQTVRVDTDLDDADSYAEDIGGLNEDTTIYFRICVEYEDEDDNETLECGSVRSFRTDT